MRKYFTLLAVGSACALLLAQSSMEFHLSSGLSDLFNVTQEDTIRFNNGSVIVDRSASQKVYNVADVDSVTFATDEVASAGDTVFVRYSDASVVVDNPFDAISVQTNGANVVVSSAADIKGVVYCLSGTSSNGSFSITPDRGYTLCLDNLSLTSASSAPLLLNAAKDGENYVATVHLRGASSLEDASGSAFKGAIYSKSKIKISDDTLYSGTSLSVKGNNKHAINSSKRIEIYSGMLNITGAASDGINADGVEVYGGDLVIAGTGGDGVDCSEVVRIEGGSVNIAVSSDDSKGLKCDSVIEISGGDLVVNVTGAGSKAVKSDLGTTISGGDIDITLAASSAYTELVNDSTDYSYNGAFTSDGLITVSNDAYINIHGDGIAARAFSSDDAISVDGGTIDIDLTGYYSIEDITSSLKDTTSVYGFKADNVVTVNGGAITITLGANANIAKGLKADYVNIMGGELTVVNNGGFWYTTSTSSSSSSGGFGGPGGGGGFNPGGSTTEVDASTPKAITADVEANIVAGTVNLTVLHGKGITSDQVINIGDKNNIDANNLLSLTINTGSSSDETYKASSEKNKYLPYCGPKSIKSDVDVNIYSGTLDITSYDSGIKGKNVTVNGGKLTISASNDQGIHGIQNLTINGGDILVTDAFEAFEGTNMTFNGGVTSIYAWDDGWNVSTSSSGSGTPALSVTGGVHYLNVQGSDTDAIDSNGSMSFTGGAVIIETGNVSLDGDNTPSYGSDAILMMFCKSAETLPSSSTNRSVSSISANTRYTAANNGTVMSSFTTTLSATQLIYSSNTTPTFTSGGTYTPGTDVVIRGKNNTTMTYSYGGTISGGSTLSSSAASAQGMGGGGGGGGRW